QLLEVIGILESFTNAELDSSARCFTASVNPALCNRLTCDAGEIVDTAGIKGIVCVRHPGHFALARADIRSRNVFARTDIALADQLSRKSPCDFFNLLFGIFLRVETNAAFRSAKRHINDGALVSHQCCQRHDLVLIHELAESSSAFDGLLMLAMLGAPAFEDLILVAAESHRKLEIVNVIARLDLRQQSRMDLQILCSAIKLFR